MEGLRTRLSSLHLANDGDSMERAYWPTIVEYFPNYEAFWRDIVIPMTRRIELNLDDPRRHERRDNIGDDLWDISYANYSLFLNIAYAADHMRLPLRSSFGDFYAHLGSICDLAEDFLLAVFVFVNVCADQEPPYPPSYTREDFVGIAGKWYDKEYSKLYEHYQRKGKMRPLFLPSRPMLLDSYFGPEHASWKAFKKVTAEVRPYRNKVVHDVALGTIVVGDGYNLVPRKDRVHDYGRMHAVHEAAGNPERLRRDFVVREEQMAEDFRGLQTALNAVWEKPLADLRHLLYEERHPTVLQKYNLDTSD